MKKLLLSGVFTLTLAPLFSQQNTVATGGDASGSNGSVSFSVGQIDYSNATGTNGNTNQGVQQPYEFFDPDSGLPFVSTIIQLFPNPTNEFVTLQMSEFDQGTTYLIYDTKGRIVREGNVTSEETQLNLSTLSQGVYHLHLTMNSNTISTIKIVKN